MTNQPPRRERGRARATAPRSERSSSVVEVGPLDLATKNGELMAEHDDLEVLGATRAHRESSQRGDETVKISIHKAPSSWSVLPGQRRTAGFSAPTGAKPHAVHSYSL